MRAERLPDLVNHDSPFGEAIALALACRRYGQTLRYRQRNTKGTSEAIVRVTFDLENDQPAPEVKVVDISSLSPAPCNPQYLKIAANTITDVFSGKIANFLDTNILLYNQIEI